MRMKKLPRPPKTKRYCVVCEQKNTFAYNPCTLHSECDECGGRWIWNITEVDKNDN